MIFWNWVLKKFGYHVCEEFTRWEEKRWQCERPARMDEHIASGGTITKVRYTSRIMERQCTICGKIQQQKLEI